MTIAIIGASASGYMASISAAKQLATLSTDGLPCRIILLERMERACKKLMATGNGRCNLTNTNAANNVEAYYHSADMKNAVDILRSFTPTDTVSLFADMGLICRTESDGRVYPLCNQAAAVVDILRLTASEYGVIEECGFDVAQIRKRHREFEIIASDGRTVTAHRVIVSAGGCSGNNLGCNGSGYNLLQAFGHSKITPFPALVPIKCKSPIPRMLTGVRFYGTVSIEPAVSEDAQQYQRGEIQFTEYGVSGIAVMQLSRIVGQQRIGGGEHPPLFVVFDFLPDISYHKLVSLLQQRAAAHPKRAREDFLTGLVNKKVGRQLMKDFSDEVSFTPKDFKAIASMLKNMRLPIQETLSWQQSQVTAGGIRLSEFDSHSLESKLCKGLYATGELLDLDGECGGYNLQWAWATGYLAGKSAASSMT